METTWHGRALGQLASDAVHEVARDGHVMLLPVSVAGRRVCGSGWYIRHSNTYRVCNRAIRRSGNEERLESEATSCYLTSCNIP